MTAFVAASETARRTAPTPSASIPTSWAYAATSRRMAPTPAGEDGNVASKETDTACGYPAVPGGYLPGLARPQARRDGLPGEAARRHERGDVPQDQRGHGGRAGSRRPARVHVRVRPAGLQPADPAH